MSFFEDVNVKVEEIITLAENGRDDMLLLNLLKETTNNCRMAYMYVFNFIKAYRVQKSFTWSDELITDYRESFNQVKVRDDLYVDIIWNDDSEWNVVNSETKEVQNIKYSIVFLKEFLEKMVRDHVISKLGEFNRDGVEYLVQMSSLYKKKISPEELFEEISFEEFEAAYMTAE
jgi:hypothetical protein